MTLSDAGPCEQHRFFLFFGYHFYIRRVKRNTTLRIAVQAREKIFKRHVAFKDDYQRIVGSDNLQ